MQARECLGHRISTPLLACLTNGVSFIAESPAHMSLTSALANIREEGHTLPKISVKKFCEGGTRGILVAEQPGEVSRGLT